MPTNPIQMQSSDAVAEVTTAMKYRKPEFIAYMTRNSTSHELIELLILLTYSKKASCTDRQLLIYQNTSDEDLAAKIYTMLHKNSFLECLQFESPRLSDYRLGLVDISVSTGRDATANSSIERY
jgi:hypothetical protein